jgi:hypothetical protein
MIEDLKGKIFSFSEIVKGRDAYVNLSKNGLLYALDLVMVVTGSNRNYAGQIIRRLPKEISCKISTSEMAGSVNTRLISFNDAIELIMVLPGNIAREIRLQFVSIIQRYLSGDSSLIKEINNNAASSGPIQQLARDSLAHKDHLLQVEAVRRKRGFDKDETLMDLIIKKKEQEITLQKKDVIDQMTRVFELNEIFFNISVSVSKNTDLDNELKNTLQENFLEIAIQSCDVKRRRTTSEI